jgi:DNA replication and repair protein RecF
MDLYLEKLILTNFKNYESESLSCSPQLNCMVGMNGMGKTNLLDAVYYLCMGKSHFKLVDSNVMRHEAGFFRLEGHFILSGRNEKIVAKVQPRRRKELERNGVSYQRLSDHVGLLPVVFIAPDDTYLISEGSEARRQFLDNTLSQLDHRYLQELIRYNQVLKQRNALLKQFGESGRSQPDLLEVYDRQLLEPAGYIHRRRRDFLADFAPYLTETVHILSGAREEVSCAYRSRLDEAPLEKLLRDAREKDCLLERSTVGIHKDDLVFLLGEHPLKRFGSQGQLKSFVLALKLAQYELLRRHKEVAPILLLDDIFDKLDRSRVEQLLGLLLSRSFGQIFITDTHEQRLENIIRRFDANYRTFKVINGHAEEMEKNGSK